MVHHSGFDGEVGRGFAPPNLPGGGVGAASLPPHPHPSESEWRTTRADPSRITAVMLYAIMQSLEHSTGNLETVYLVSNVKEHYQWFVDRSFVFAMFKGQIEQVKETIINSPIPQEQKRYIEQMLNNITHNIIVYNQTVQGDTIQGDKVGGDKAGGDKVGGDKVV